MNTLEEPTTVVEQDTKCKSYPRPAIRKDLIKVTNIDDLISQMISNPIAIEKLATIHERILTRGGNWHA